MGCLYSVYVGRSISQLCVERQETLKKVHDDFQVSREVRINTFLPHYDVPALIHRPPEEQKTINSQDSQIVTDFSTN
jgi:hypothetical protein